MPKIGDSAPSFTLPGSGNTRVSLADFTGKKVVLYFYPKDDTPGCTKEACDFRDHSAAYKAAGAEVIGISPDSTQSHDEFKAKYQLPFLLLEDADHSVAEAFGVWREKTLYGRTFMGIVRSTFVIDEKQKISAVFDRVQVDGHADHVLAVLKGEQPAPAYVEPAAPKGGQKVSSEPARMTPRVEPKAAAKAVPAKALPAKPVAAAKPAPAKAAAKPAVAKPAAKAAAKPAAKKAASKPVKKAAAKPAAKKAVAKPAAKKAAAKPAKKAPAKKPAPKAKKRK